MKPPTFSPGPMKLPIPIVPHRAPRRFASSSLLGGWLAVAAASSSLGASFSATPGTAVPDGNLSGLVSALNVPAGLGTITDVNVSLTLTGDRLGGWNGDVYALLAHDGVFSVLMNRPGRTAIDSFGYSDDGVINLTLDDEAIWGDFHLYQTEPGVSLIPGAPMSGTWQPDARATDPDLVVDTDLRTNFLSVFDGQQAEGEWWLFVVDASPGASFTLSEWELVLETGAVVIPESSWGGWFGLLSVAVLMGGAARRRSR